MTGQPYKHATAAHLLENAIQYAIVEEMQNAASVNSPKSTIVQAAHKHPAGKQSAGGGGPSK